MPPEDAFFAASASLASLASSIAAAASPAWAFGAPAAAGLAANAAQLAIASSRVQVTWGASLEITVWGARPNFPHLECLET